MAKNPHAVALGKRPTSCEQCYRDQERIGARFVRIRLNARGLCAACVCHNSEAAAALGKRGGSVKSARKAAASRENGKRGGRPPKQDLAYKIASGRNT